ncbi:AMP-binding protein [Neopusillimonas aromaticivorans]|uniref:AMP-binding protein n=1 Tax=Neopusillimonas aromaticivorans TaxID=2979868 RepID=UPI002594C23C|nr:AMP-binding protein [Neopusillimonas aromaticivorans]WJJ93139.1 AMP-binding protein [Neopusillimonas aromaticivorans]
MNDQYPALYASFRWHVPASVNIAQLCLQRWAVNPLQGRRPALFTQNEFGEARRCSYGELAVTTGKLATGLQKMGLAQGDRVAVAMSQGPEFVAACLAVLAAGGVVLPLSPVLNAHQVTARIIDARANIAIVDATQVPGIVHAQSVYPALGQIIGYGFQHDSTLSWSSLLARQPDVFKIADTTAQSPAFLFIHWALTPPEGRCIATQCAHRDVARLCGITKLVPARSRHFLDRSALEQPGRPA